MSKKQAASKTPAKKEKGIDPSYYENHCFADDFIQAKKDGNLIIPRKGESTLQAVKRHFEEKKKTTAVSMRVPVYIVNMAKAQAKAAGVPYTSFMVAALERAMAR
jgi:hypothetical protein